MADGAKTVKVPPWLARIVIGRRPKWTLIRVATLILVAYVLFKFVLIPIQVKGESMLPTYHTGQINFINRLAYRQHGPERGDVVGIPWLDQMDGKVLLLKRVVGLPNETISFSNNVLFINSQPLDEPYVRWHAEGPYNEPWMMAPILLGPDQYYVVGDNRTMPIRNHTQGKFHLTQIAGRVLWGAHPKIPDDG